MVRLGEKMLAVTPQGETSGLVAISVRTPKVGSKVLSIPTDSGNIAVQPFNAYTGDEGIGVCLPCGSTVFLPGEPPNYLPSSWERGFPMSVSQSAPVSLGWSCDNSCPINPGSGHVCARYQNGGSVDIYSKWFCTHVDYKSIWLKNQDNNWVWNRLKYYCSSNCPSRFSCPGYGYDTYHYEGRYGGSYGSQYPSRGCINLRYRMGPVEKTYLDANGSVARDFWQCYGGKGGRCPWYNNGRGTPSCPIGPSPNISVPCLSKPATCRYQDKLKFNGWLMEGRTKSEDTTCVFAKATEGVRSRSTDSIRCDFMNRGSGQSVGSYNGSGDVRLPISPSNTEGFGKAGSDFGARASISVNSTIDTDYTRVPTPRSNSGTACIFSIGRYLIKSLCFYQSVIDLLTAEYHNRIILSPPP